MRWYIIWTILVTGIVWLLGGFPLAQDVFNVGLLIMFVALAIIGPIAH
jgi:hypothetical protein